MGEYRFTISTEATPAQAYRFLRDPKNLEAWAEEIDAVEGSGPWKLTIGRAFLPDVVFDTTVVEDEPDRLVTFRNEHKSMVTNDRYAISADGDGSAVEYRGTFELHGTGKLNAPVLKLFESRMEKQFGRRLQRSLDAHARASAA